MNSTAIITGASRGIGRACALKLASHFKHIVINSYHNSDELLKVKSEVEAKGAECLVFTGDIGDFDFVKDMISEIVERKLTIELLVNNAGISYIGLLTDMTPEDWNSIIRTNLTSVFNCCNQVVPHMVHEKHGHIISISSMWGLNGASCEVAYSASKGGVNAFTMALAKELAPSNIRVNALACGAVDTDMNSCLTPEEIDSLCDDIPTGRLATPDEIADMVYLLYSSPAYLTGEIIKIDGGYI
ncbi:MAG: SDR family NAD(P)-dependent oxidoreductase [Lachnospiraceae bacterium]|nr:SDR family NAD(P)-dependent oxidoreductase [Lachnospiraceae bacterium]